MQDAQFWRDLGERFRMLPDHFPFLKAQWGLRLPDDELPSERTWHLNGGNSALKSQFESLAQLAGAKVPVVLIGADSNYLYRWLDLLQKEGHFSYSDVQFSKYAVGAIEDLRNASVTVCLTLETRASLADLENEAFEPSVTEGSAQQTAPIDQPLGGASARMPGSVISFGAARRMADFIRARNIGVTDFAGQAETTDRTIRSFKKNGKVRRDIFNRIALAMGKTPEELLRE